MKKKSILKPKRHASVYVQILLGIKLAKILGVQKNDSKVKSAFSLMELD